MTTTIHHRGVPADIVYSPDEGGYYCDPWYDPSYDGGIHESGAAAATAWRHHQQTKDSR